MQLFQIGNYIKLLYKNKLQTHLMNNKQPLTQCSTPRHALQFEQQKFSIKDAMVHKVIAANQQMLKSQCLTIATLKNQLSDFKQRCIQAQHKLAILIDSTPKDGKTLIQQLLNRISQLEKHLTQEKIRSAMRQEQALESKFLSIKEIKSLKKIEILRENVSDYVNVSSIRKDQEIFSRKRKNSQEQQNNMSTWLKAYDTYSNDANPDKFKQKTVNLVRKFIPHDFRAKAWPLIFDNKIGITNALYIELLQRRNNDWVSAKVKSQIDKDLLRSFCGKTQFQGKIGLSLQVAQVLEIFHIFRPDVSYVQGMTYPVIVLVLIVGKIKAFRIFSNLILGNDFYRRLFTFESDYVNLYCRTFDQLLKQQNKVLAQKLQSDKIQSQIYLIEWFFTFFSRGMSFEFTLKVWDLFAYHGEIIHFRLGLAIFSQIGNKLLQTSYEDSIGVIRDYCYHLQQEQLMKSLLNHKLPKQKIQTTLNKLKKSK